MEHKAFNIIGIMSGTSLDGIDLAHCTFRIKESEYTFQLNACRTYPFSKEWSTRLNSLPESSALEYAMTHTALGKLLGTLVNEFLKEFPFKVDYVASHGQTIFHQPAKGYTSQIGEGAAIAAMCGYPVICDFRTSDVGHGGQGAPLVPIGDEFLFGSYGACLNLGGFANISFRQGTDRIAFDICPANFILNPIAGMVGEAFDKDGIIASKGKIVPDLLTKLNSLPYYFQSPPKSMGREWVEMEVNPLINEFKQAISIEDLMRTLVEHIAIQISKSMSKELHGSMMISGGGAHNTFLVERICEHSPIPIVIPEKNVVDFKEALIFAFLGLLRILERPNSLSSVTGAKKNVSGGAIYLP
ncbi:MAG: anhydro-N-acetylmuramic acid kinase [Bacteroidales bacterium]|nr:anhydro-N-acetylmuramic acid kinase [Bacteroidales bacterium]